MTKTQKYVIWLDGFLEACEKSTTEDQTKIIKDKLNGIFDHVAEPPKGKLSLQDLGKTHGFDVFETPPSTWPGNDESGVVYRC